MKVQQKRCLFGLQLCQDAFLCGVCSFSPCYKWVSSMCSSFPHNPKICRVQDIAYCLLRLYIYIFNYFEFVQIFKATLCNFWLSQRLKSKTNLLLLLLFLQPVVSQRFAILHDPWSIFLPPSTIYLQLHATLTPWLRLSPIL